RRSRRRNCTRPSRRSNADRWWSATTPRSSPPPPSSTRSPCRGCWTATSPSSTRRSRHSTADRSRRAARRPRAAPRPLPATPKAIVTTTTAPPQARPARTALLLGGALLALGGAVLLSLAVGSKPTTPGQVWAALTHTADPYIAAVVASRYPRTVLGVLAGAALALSGLLMQGITRNPLADPGLLGVNAGAMAAVVTAIALLGPASTTATVW